MRIAERLSAARFLNLALPGGGLILLDRPWQGMTLGLLFAILANFVVAATLIVPDDVPGWLRGLGVALAGGAYAGAQIRLEQTIRARRRDAAVSRRRAALYETQKCLEAGLHDAALEALRPVAAEASGDLLVAYRLAQVLTAKRDLAAARAAWQQLRTLDQHRIYRHEIELHLRVLYEE